MGEGFLVRLCRDVVAEDLHGEVLLCDTDRAVVHRVPTADAPWAADLALGVAVEVGDDLLVRQLIEARLVEQVSATADPTRRQIITRTAGAAAVAGVASIALPKVAAAASGPPVPPPPPPPPPPLPTVTSVVPSSGVDAGGTSVTITGTEFTGASAVTFGGTNATTFTVNSSTQITATVPARVAGVSDATGVVDVRVTTPNGQSAIAAGAKYTYAGPPFVEAWVFTPSFIDPGDAPIALQWFTSPTSGVAFTYEISGVGTPLTGSFEAASSTGPLPLTVDQNVFDLLGDTVTVTMTASDPSVLGPVGMTSPFTTTLTKPTAIGYIDLVSDNGNFGVNFWAEGPTAFSYEVTAPWLVAPITGNSTLNGSGEPEVPFFPIPGFWTGRAINITLTADSPAFGEFTTTRVRMS